ncbi:hypothetical protein V6617_01310 [Pelagibacterium nitratireducens]|uniref:Uncharacterized protein n=1 Tax=Pelagibacterium nitratireducens TaxID=1046114 RepID=A0ABZ2I5Q1_9HYPH
MIRTFGRAGLATAMTLYLSAPVLADDTDLVNREQLAANTLAEQYIDDDFYYEGEPDHSWLRAVFMYTSKVIGRENPDSFEIDAPIGSIGIRG